MAGGVQARPEGRSWFWVQGLACGVLVTTAAPLALVLAVLFAPALLAGLMVAPGMPRRLGGILTVYGMAAALPWLQAMWGAAQDWTASLDLLSATSLLAACWGAQAASWLFGQLAPLAVGQVLEVQVRARANRLREARSRLQAEWGLGGTE